MPTLIPRERGEGRDIMAKRKSILLAEDNKDEREMLQMLLEGSGYKVVAVPDGKKALHHLKSHRFDLVILDIMMPKVDGVEICNKLKHSRRLMRMPVLILSALARGSRASEARWQRDTLADAFIAKPFDTRDLLRVVDDLITHPVTEEEAAEKMTQETHLGDLTDLMKPGDVARDARLRRTKMEISTQFFHKSDAHGGIND